MNRDLTRVMEQGESDRAMPLEEYGRVNKARERWQRNVDGKYSPKEITKD